MSKPKGGLGRGLGSLIGGGPSPATAASAFAKAPADTSAIVRTDPASAASDKPVFEPATIEPLAGEVHIRYISPSEISINPHQPRKYFAEDELKELTDSIREHGVLQPLVVNLTDKGTYELIAGERRLRASKAANLEKIPVVVRASEDEHTKLELALIENIQRQDLNPVEEAQAYKKMMTSFGLRQEDVATKVGKSRPAVANALRLLELDEDILQALAEGKITRSHARTLLAEPDLERRRELYKQMLKGDMTVREAEAKAGSRNVRQMAGKDPNIAALEGELREKLGTKVTIDIKGGAGKVGIHFYSREDLKELINKLSKD